MSEMSQLRLLLWKHFLQQRRSVIFTILEIVVPVSLAVALIVTRSTKHIDKRPNDSTVWKSVPLNGSNKGMPDCSPSCKLYFSPSTNPAVVNIMKRASDVIPSISEVVGFPDAATMERDLLAKLNEAQHPSAPPGVKIDDTLAAVSFTQVPVERSSSDSNFAYTIRFPPSRLVETASVLGENSREDYQWSGEKNNSTSDAVLDDLQEIFLQLQHGIDQSIISLTGRRSKVSDAGLVSVWMRNCTKQRHIVADGFSFNSLVSFIVCISSAVCVVQIFVDVVREKAGTLKEFMRIQGLSGRVHWIAWFIKFFLLLLVTVIIQTILFKVKVGDGSVISQTDGVILFIFLLCYAISTIMFCFMFSTFFPNATIAATYGYLVYIVSLFLPSLTDTDYANLSFADKLSYCLISNRAMTFGFRVIEGYEAKGAGVQWDTIAKGVTVDDDFAMIHVILMLLLDSVIYGLGAWYIENIYPVRGMPLPFCFPCMLSGRGERPETLSETTET